MRQMLDSDLFKCLDCELIGHYESSHIGDVRLAFYLVRAIPDQKGVRPVSGYIVEADQQRTFYAKFDAAVVGYLHEKEALRDRFRNAL